MLASIAVLFGWQPAYADVKFGSGLFSDGMVVQRNTPVPMWGIAEPGEGVIVSFAGQQKSTTTAATGRWIVTLDPMPAGGPFDLTVSGATIVQLHNVFVGEVWVCSGQSNMVIGGPPDTTLAEFPSVHTYKTRNWNDRPAGVPFWFGAELSSTLGVTVGLINEAVGGSNIRLWLGSSAITDPDSEVAAILGARAYGGHYQHKILSVQPFAIRGVAWWQGEADEQRPLNYSHLLPALIRSWRQEWGRGDFPFLFVQLPTGGGLHANELAPPLPDKPPLTEAASLMRDAYLKALALPNTAMMITTDLDGGTHPRDREGYGRRLGQLALGAVYGQPGAYSGPTYAYMTIEGSRIRLHFRASTANGLHATGSAPLQGFSISADNQTFEWANAEIQGSEVVVWSDNILNPIAVRYAWNNKPRWANLFNGSDLGAAPFSTDAMPGPIQEPSSTPTLTPSPTATPLPTRTPTSTNSPTVSPTASGPTRTPTQTLTPSLTATPSLTPTTTQTPTVTQTRTFTASPTITPTPTPTLTRTVTSTSTVTPSTFCDSGVSIDGALLRVVHNLDPAGDETLKLFGVLAPIPLSPVVDPQANGLTFDIADRNGVRLFSRAVPGGTGWSVNAPRTLWIYRDPSGILVPGITRVTISTHDHAAFKFVVTGKNSNFQIPADRLPLRLFVVLGGTAQSAAGQCGTRVLGGPTSPHPSCHPNFSGTILSCR